MSPESISGSGRRTYRSQLRRQQAEATRARVVVAAAELFAADGYVRTTVAKIAAAAGVSAETVQGQGSKAALLIAAMEHAAFGVIGDTNILELDVGRQLLAIDDFWQAVDFCVDIQTDAHERTARLGLALFGGAGADPELDRYLNDLMAGMNRQSRRILGFYRDRGWLRGDVPFDELVETSAVISSMETFLRITHRDGWTVADYRAWLRRMVTETVMHTAQRN